ncbi:MAG: hypothetical protein ACKVI4_09905 [Actinomycetales bacterium]
MPKVIGKDSNFDINKLKIGDEWRRLSDVVAVMVDLKSSTNLAKGKKAPSVASIYDAGVGGVVVIFETFDADFVDIQGDGGFALFWGDRRYERAMTAAITTRSFSDDFAAQLKNKWDKSPETGFKVAIASGPVLVKLVGLPRHLDLQEPVWAGRPVNYAAKAAQQTDPGALLVTASVWDAIENNDYIAFSCGCNSAPALLWSDYEMEKIPDDEMYGKSLGTKWCAKHGEDFCNAILNGETERDDITDSMRSDRTSLSFGSVEKNDARKRRDLEREARKAESLSLIEELLT